MLPGFSAVGKVLSISIGRKRQRKVFGIGFKMCNDNHFCLYVLKSIVKIKSLAFWQSTQHCAVFFCRRRQTLFEFFKRFFLDARNIRAGYVQSLCHFALGEGFACQTVAQLDYFPLAVFEYIVDIVIQLFCI